MPITDDIRAALARNDADAAEALIVVVASKRHGAGLSGHDLQIFTRQIERIRFVHPDVEPEPELEPAPEPPTGPVRGAGGRFVKVIKTNPETGDFEPA